MKAALPLFTYINPQNYAAALNASREKFAQLDPQEAAVRSGCEYDAQRGHFKVVCLNHLFTVTYPYGVVTYENTDLVPMFSIQLIILNYLWRADGTPLTYRHIPFRELDGANVFDRAFYKTALVPICRKFGEKPELLLQAAQAFGGFSLMQSNGVALQLFLLPRVPMIYKLWPGDEELEAAVTILFDSSANHYLHSEDLAAASFISELLVSQA